MTTTWTIEFAAPVQIASVNSGKHWSTTSRIRGAWREAMVWHLKAAKPPVGLGRIRVDIELRFPTGAHRDASNYHPLVAKPIVDACGPSRRVRRTTGPDRVEPGYGLIPDDEPRKHLHCEDCPHLRISDMRGPRPYGQVVVVITDITEGN